MGPRPARTGTICGAGPRTHAIGGAHSSQSGTCTAYGVHSSQSGMCTLHSAVADWVWGGELHEVQIPDWLGQAPHVTWVLDQVPCVAQILEQALHAMQIPGSALGLVQQHVVQLRPRGSTRG